MKEQTMEEYLQEQLDGGYIDEKGQPLKCGHCDSTDLVEKRDRMDFMTVEIEVTCGACKKPVGHWAYGNWMV